MCICITLFTKNTQILHWSETEGTNILILGRSAEPHVNKIVCLYVGYKIKSERVWNLKIFSYIFFIKGIAFQSQQQLRFVCLFFSFLLELAPFTQNNRKWILHKAEYTLFFIHFEENRNRKVKKKTNKKTKGTDRTLIPL